MSLPLVVAAHGTRSAAGLSVVRSILAAVRATRPDLEVVESYLDVASPTFADVIADRPDPVAVVPLLLSGGYHVRVDIPSMLAGRTGDPVSAPLGPDPLLADALADRLADARADRSPSAQVVLAWAGSSDPLARADAARAADLLADRLGRPVRTVALSGPDRVRGVEPGAEVASYLLSPGEFADRAAALGGAVTSDPLGAHPAIGQLVLRRYDSVVAAR